MNKFKKIEKLLNKQPVPLDFNFSKIINFKFSDNKIHMRILLSKEKDQYSILDDDNSVALLDVVYDGVTVDKMILYDILYLKNLNVLRYSLDDNHIVLMLYDYSYDCYFNLSFEFKKFSWQIFDIIPKEDFDDYNKKLVENLQYIQKIQKQREPEWVKLNDGLNW